MLQTWSWSRAGVDAVVPAGRLSLLFAGLITGIGLLIVVYAHFYLSPTDSVGKFYSQMMLFMAAMLGWFCRTTCCCSSCFGS